MAGDIKWSGYKAAASNVLTTEMNSLADGNCTALSSEQDNSSNNHIYADFQLDLASLTISSTAAFVEVYIVPSVDGSNYPDWGSSTYANYNAQYYAGSLMVKNVSSSAARANLRSVVVPPGKFKVALRNRTGATLASSGNTLAIRYYNDYYA